MIDREALLKQCKETFEESRKSVPRWHAYVDVLYDLLWVFDTLVNNTPLEYCDDKHDRLLDMSAQLYNKEFERTPKYEYKDGACSFKIDGCEFEVADLRNMRKSTAGSFKLERYYDICILIVCYINEDGCYVQQPLPSEWLFGSTSDEFNEGQPVHTQFIEAAEKFIDDFGGAEKLRKAQQEEA